ncbi:acyltransferase domain-containing protein [Streptomyces sp. NBC_00385]|uniref:acyltransferase domain-containing protein n=1 Tax=Streptomyces sp. NBC_00385 TaxID=2975733 RepID=UPI002DDBF520|nr:acyltransferase domain-containing protein [Streptomyces sp. NBC_00385]WRZ04092.1 acyltransferase domain-containing protein [Streptomyces sp. NBC_00385]
MTAPIALLLPGQGAQHPGMARELYGREPEFTATLDGFFDLMGAPGRALRDDWLTDTPAVPLDDASRSQPLLFALGYAIGRALRSRGVHPRAVLGHSVGELAGAALAGVFDLPSAARIMLARTEAMAKVPAGGMLAVAAPPQTLAPWTEDIDPCDPGRIALAAVNAPAQTVLAGPEEALSHASRSLRRAGLAARRVPALQPFHCPATEGAAAEFIEAFAREPLHAPALRVQSTRTARPVEAAEAVDPRFWAGQLSRPVFFWPALDALLREGPWTLVETGPGRGLSLFARRHPEVRAGRSEVVALLPSHAPGTYEAWLAAVERLAGAAAPAGT